MKGFWLEVQGGTKANYPFVYYAEYFFSFFWRLDIS